MRFFVFFFFFLLSISAHRETDPPPLPPLFAWTTLKVNCLQSGHPPVGITICQSGTLLIEVPPGGAAAGDEVTFFFSPTKKHPKTFVTGGGGSGGAGPQKQEGQRGFAEIIMSSIQSINSHITVLKVRFLLLSLIFLANGLTQNVPPT